MISVSASVWRLIQHVHVSDREAVKLWCIIILWSTFRHAHLCTLFFWSVSWNESCFIVISRFSFFKMFYPYPCWYRHLLETFFNQIMDFILARLGNYSNLCFVKRCSDSLNLFLWFIPGEIVRPTGWRDQPDGNYQLHARGYQEHQTEDRGQMWQIDFFFFLICLDE